MIRRRSVLQKLLLGLAMLTAAASPTHLADQARDIVVINHSDRTINEVYASPSLSEDWGSDHLGDATIEPDQSRRLDLGPGSARQCLFDVQIVYSDASREERRRVDLCRTHTLTFDASAAVAPLGPDNGEHRVLIANESDLPIQQVLISPAEAGDWGDDRLTHETLSVGDSASVAYRGGCLADLRIVYENRSAEERRGLDLCALHGVTIKPGWTTAASVTTPRPTEPVLPPLPLSVTIVNHAGRTIQELYLFPEPSAQNGPDRLPAALEDGGRVVIDLLRPAGSCRFGAHIVYGGKVADQDLANLDLCHEPTLVVPPRT